MSEFKNGFIDAYRADLISMLDLAEELALFHDPYVFIRGNLHSGDMDVTIAGLAVQEQDSESEESIQARRDAAIGLTRLHGLDARAIMQLFASELSTVIPAGTTEYSAEQEELANNIVHNAQSQIQGADHSYSVFSFIRPESGEGILVASTNITSSVSQIHARSLTLSVSDTYITKELTINEMPVSFNGETVLDVAQSISPVDDEVLHEAVELFYENGSPEDINIIIGLFTSELTGQGNASHEVEGLLDRFEAIGKVEQLKRIIENIKQKAIAAKMDSSFSLASPEVTLPSVAELNEYKALLSQIRS